MSYGHKNMELIHYSSEIITSLEPRQYDQEEKFWQHKPNGLWVSVGEEWKEWCEAEKFKLDSLKHVYSISMNDNANILHIETVKQIYDFTEKFQLEKTTPLHPFNYTDQLNWNQVKQKYQGIIIAPYQWDCRLSTLSSWYYGWDCASGCIWDLTCIKEFKKINE
jgi:hypothetical protein